MYEGLWLRNPNRSDHESHRISGRVLLLVSTSRPNSPSPMVRLASGRRSAGCSRHPMVPLYAAGTRDLGSGDFVVVECGACGHDGLIHPVALSSLGLGPDDRLVDLAPRLRCPECDAKGKAIVSVRWSDMPA
jgi:hypothetical protein